MTPELRLQVFFESVPSIMLCSVSANAFQHIAYTSFNTGIIHLYEKNIMRFYRQDTMAGKYCNAMVLWYENTILYHL